MFLCIDLIASIN